MNTIYINSAVSFSDEWDLKSLIPDANMRRRMSKMIKMGVASGLKCLSEAGIASPNAIITASGYGCLADSEKFLSTLISNNEQLLNPTPFIQSTFNTIGSQIAILTNCTQYNMTYVDGIDSFDSALLDGILCANDGNNNVLIGIADELTQTLFDIFVRMHIISENKRPIDGAFFFLLSNQKSDKSIATISNVQLESNTKTIAIDNFPTDHARLLFEKISNKSNTKMHFQKFSFDLQCL